MGQAADAAIAMVLRDRREDALRAPSIQNTQLAAAAPVRPSAVAGGIELVRCDRSREERG